MEGPSNWRSRRRRDPHEHVDDEILQMASTVLFSRVSTSRNEREPPVPCRTSALSGRAWVNEVINGHSTRIMENMRINVDTFMRLCDILTVNEFVKQNYQKRVTIEEALAMTLVFLSHSHRFRVLAERFQHSTETVCRNVHEILDGLCELGRHIIRPRDQENVHPKISNDLRFYPWFKNAVGAIDGTHIPAYCPATEQVAYTNRHGTRSQNVLVACDFDMCVVYVYAGWEGNAHDARVLDGALTRPNHFLMPPPGRYYLVDSAYRNIPGFIAPYRGHVAPIGGGSGGQTKGARTAKQLFNQRHSSLRNVIERTFGVLKKRFSVLAGDKPNFEMDTQIQAIIASCTVHNFIRDYQVNDDIFNEFGEEMEIDGFYGVPPIPDIQHLNVNATVRTQWNGMRDAIAEGIWDAYRSRQRS